MKRIARFLVNWLVIVLAPLWVFWMFWFWIITDYDIKSSMIFSGKRWFWE